MWVNGKKLGLAYMEFENLDPFPEGCAKIVSVENILVGLMQTWLSRV